MITQIKRLGKLAESALQPLDNLGDGADAPAPPPKGGAEAEETEFGLAPASLTNSRTCLQFELRHALSVNFEDARSVDCAALQPVVLNGYSTTDAKLVNPDFVNCYGPFVKNKTPLPGEPMFSNICYTRATDDKPGMLSVSIAAPFKGPEGDILASPKSTSDTPACTQEELQAWVVAGLPQELATVKGAKEADPADVGECAIWREVLMMVQMSPEMTLPAAAVTCTGPRIETKSGDAYRLCSAESTPAGPVAGVEVVSFDSLQNCVQAAEAAVSQAKGGGKDGRFNSTLGVSNRTHSNETTVIGQLVDELGLDLPNAKTAAKDHTVDPSMPSGIDDSILDHVARANGAADYADDGGGEASDPSASPAPAPALAPADEGE